MAEIALHLFVQVQHVRYLMQDLLQ